MDFYTFPRQKCQKNEDKFNESKLMNIISLARERGNERKHESCSLHTFVSRGGKEEHLEAVRDGPGRQYPKCSTFITL